MTFSAVDWVVLVAGTVALSILLAWLFAGPPAELASVGGEPIGG